MKNLFVLLCLIFSGAMVSAQTNSDENISSEDMNELLQDAMKELQMGMDTMDLSEFFSGSMMNFGNLDSLNLDGLFGDDSGMSIQQFFPENMESEDFDQMLEQGMKMMQNMDMGQLEKMMEGIDMNEIQKMMEGFNMEEFQGMFPQTQPADQEKDKKKKNQKRI